MTRRIHVLSAMLCFSTGPLASAQETVAGLPSACKLGLYLRAAAPETTPQPLILHEGTKRRMANLGGFLLAGPLGASLKFKSVLQGPEAMVRTDQQKPEFQFCFSTTEPLASADKSGGDYVGPRRDAGSPRDYILVRLSLNGKQRELEIQNSSITGPQGAASKSAIRFETEKTSDAVYRVWLEAPLPAGEYAFFRTLPGQKGAAAVDQFFDFAVTGGLPSHKK